MASNGPSSYSHMEEGKRVEVKVELAGNVGLRRQPSVLQSRASLASLKAASVYQSSNALKARQKVRTSVLTTDGVTDFNQVEERHATATFLSMLGIGKVSDFKRRSVRVLILGLLVAVGAMVLTGLRIWMGQEAYLTLGPNIDIRLKECGLSITVGSALDRWCSCPR